MMNIFQFRSLIIILGVALLSACTFSPQSKELSLQNPPSERSPSWLQVGYSSWEVFSGSQEIIPMPPPEAQFKDLIQELEKSKNYSEFSNHYNKVSSQIDSLILNGSWGLIFSYEIIDNVVPYIYICKLTLSGDENIIRDSIWRYSTIIPPIVLINSSESNDPITLFLGKKSDLAALYDLLLSDKVQLPEYYIDLIWQRKSSLWKEVNDDCQKLIMKHEKALFTANK